MNALQIRVVQLKSCVRITLAPTIAITQNKISLTKIAGDIFPITPAIFTVLKYFVEVGMGQMDQASAEFDPISYRYEYANLRKVYGDVWAGYYRHYARWGKAAGLHGTGCTQMQDYTTVYSGDNLDYDCVYDYNYYVAQHPEVEKQCNYDDSAVLKYFVEVGMWQKQQGSAEFNLVWQ